MIHTETNRSHNQTESAARVESAKARLRDAASGNAASDGGNAGSRSFTDQVTTAVKENPVAAGIVVVAVLAVVGPGRTARMALRAASIASLLLRLAEKNEEPMNYRPRTAPPPPGPARQDVVVRSRDAYMP